MWCALCELNATWQRTWEEYQRAERSDTIKYGMWCSLMSGGKSRSSLEPLRTLHVGHAATTLSHVVGPPFDCGTTWS